MTSEERHEARYQRRSKSRIEKRKAKLTRLGGYDDVFSYEKLYDAFYLCKKGVRWKGSIQKYEALLPFNTLTIYNALKLRKFKPMGFLEFDLNERGKLRHIRALSINERCIQRTLCDNYLAPIIEPVLVYDNGASIKNKGIDFSLNRLKCHLSRYYRKYHTNDGYIFQYDFSSYFDNINHDILLKMVYKMLPDKEIYSVVEKMVRIFGEKGLGLGSQVSQIFAIFYPTMIDRMFKEQLHIKGYGRYMDDGYCICHTKEEAQRCKEALFEICKEYDITINENKIKVSKISKPFIFLKKRIFMTETGHIVLRICRKAAIRARRRLKKLSKKVLDDNENFSMVDFRECYKAWYGIARRMDNFYICQNFRKLYLRLVSQIVEKQTEKMEFERCLKSQRMAELQLI